MFIWVSPLRNSILQKQLASNLLIQSSLT